MQNEIETNNETQSGDVVTTTLTKAEVQNDQQTPVQTTIETNQFSPETLEKSKIILSDTGLNWDVRKEDLISKPSGLETPNAGVFRSDTNKWIGTTSKRYVLYQNHELANTIIEAASQFNLEVVEGGELDGGQRVFLQLELPMETIGKTDVKRYVTAMNSHNAKGSVAFGSTNNILSYNVRFFRVFSQLDKFRHCSSVSEKVRVAVNQLFKTISQDKAMMDSFRMMAGVKLQDDLLQSVMESCFRIDPAKDQSDLSPRQLNRINNITDSVRATVRQEEGSVWGLFAGILNYTKNSVPKNRKEQDYVMSGAGYKTNLRAYETITNWLSKNANG